MNVKKAVFAEEERREILAEMKQDHPHHVYRRLLALKLKAVDGMRSDETAKVVGMCQTAVNKIVNRYQVQGMETIIGKRHKGGHRYMSMEEEKVFLSGIRSRAEAGKVIEVSEIHKAYQEAVGREVTKEAIYYLLKKHGWRKVMPRGRHPKKASEEAIEAYKKNHRNDPRAEKGAAETACDVRGRGWIWSDQ